MKWGDFCSHRLTWSHQPQQRQILAWCLCQKTVLPNERKLGPLPSRQVSLEWCWKSNLQAQTQQQQQQGGVKQNADGNPEQDRCTRSTASHDWTTWTNFIWNRKDASEIRPPLLKYPQCGSHCFVDGIYSCLQSHVILETAGPPSSFELRWLFSQLASKF